MNIAVILYLLCWVLQVEGFLLLLPCATALCYGEKSGWVFAVLSVIYIFLGTLGKLHKPKNQMFYAKEGFVTVSLSWIVLSVAGAVPFVLTGAIPSWVDALFETISGFTTTGASILKEVESLDKCVLLWRSFSHWIGGMGVLVFILAVLPLTGGYNMYLMKAESPGPSVGKLVPKLRHTAQILYGIYLVMTITQIIVLLITGMPLFDSLTLSFGTAGTGGFGVRNDSVASYTALQQNIITIYMILFGVNFNLYYLFLIRKPKQALQSEELHFYFGAIFGAIVIISLMVRDQFSTWEETIRHTAFQVGSVITSTGYSTTDFNVWPEFVRTLIILLMFMGACAGSTGGGIKVSRIMLLIKSAKYEIYHAMHPRSVKQIHFEGHVVDRDVLHSVQRFLIIYCLIYIVSMLLISLDGMDYTTNFTAIVATLNNIGPGLGEVGPAGNFSGFSDFSKIVLMFDMLAGRLELLPMIVLFAPSTWKK